MLYVQDMCLMIVSWRASGWTSDRLVLALPCPVSRAGAGNHKLDFTTSRAFPGHYCTEEGLIGSGFLLASLLLCLRKDHHPLWLFQWPNNGLVIQQSVVQHQRKERQSSVGGEFTWLVQPPVLFHQPRAGWGESAGRRGKLSAPAETPQSSQTAKLTNISSGEYQVILVRSCSYIAVGYKCFSIPSPLHLLSLKLSSHIFPSDEAVDVNVKSQLVLRITVAIS